MEPSRFRTCDEQDQAEMMQYITSMTKMTAWDNQEEARRQNKANKQQQPKRATVRKGRRR